MLQSRMKTQTNEVQCVSSRCTDRDGIVTLSLHMGIGCGQLTAVHVGGVFKRWEYILSGPPMKQVLLCTTRPVTDMMDRLQ